MKKYVILNLLASPVMPDNDPAEGFFHMKMSSFFFFFFNTLNIHPMYLLLQVSEVERNSSAQVGILHKQIEDLKKNITQNSDTTDIVYTNLKLDLFNLSTSVQQQLDTISKMEGPRVSD